MQKTHYQSPKLRLKPNPWDFAAFIILLMIFAILVRAAHQMQVPFQIGTPLKISLSPTMLPSYAASTVLRMLIALVFSLLFTLIVAPVAAKNRQAEKLLIPAIDILQSVPILGMLSITVVAFIKFFPNSRLGPECAAIFAVFTSQVWNMTLSFYQSIRTTPKEFYETARIFHLSSWQQFWHVELPYAIPALLWNAMISMSAGWFFIVASEAITVSNQNIMLPGIGSYISVAIAQANLKAMFYAILTMFIVILTYDQVLFRPLLTWSERFNIGHIEGKPPPRAWFYRLLTKTRWLKILDRGIKAMAEVVFNSPRVRFPLHVPALQPKYNEMAIWCWNSILLLGVAIAAFFLWNFITQAILPSEIRYVFYLGSITGIKVAILVLLASLLWVPIGVWIGLHPKIGQRIQPLTQFLAAFPVNLIYPLIVKSIIYFHLNIEIWTTPLMILGTQWYILFNIIAGTAAIPKELHLVAQNFRVKGWLWWKRLALPAIFPYYVTGSMTAAAGCWNASIVADVVEWGKHKLVATGLGSYIAQYTATGDFPRIALGIAVMSIYVLVINHLVWRKLYNLAHARFTLE